MSRNEELIELFPELNTENTPFEDSMDKMLLSNRTVFLYGEIDEVSIERVLKQLIILEHKDASQPTTLFISSSGGSIYDALGLCDYMLMTAMPIKVVVIGKAMSAASIITICGTKGLRSAYRNSRFMFHELSDSANDEKFSDQKIRLEENKYLMETFTNLILKRTTISKAQISKYNGSEFYVSAEGALKVGIIDSVIGDDLKSEKNGCVGKKNSRRTR